MPNHGEDLFIKVEEELVQSSKSIKLLEVMIDNKLNFNQRVSNICRKVSLKLHALARVSHYMNTEKLRLILKAFTESQFGYCPLMWMFHSRACNNRINRLHERVLKVGLQNSLSYFRSIT